jgi:AraC family transcriptional regulator
MLAGLYAGKRGFFSKFAERLAYFDKYLGQTLKCVGIGGMSRYINCRRDTGMNPEGGIMDTLPHPTPTRRVDALGAMADFRIGTLGDVASPRGVRLIATQSLHTGMHESHLITDARAALFRYSLRMPRDVQYRVGGRPMRQAGTLGFAGSGITVDVSVKGAFTTLWCSLSAQFLDALSETDRGLALRGIELMHAIDSPRLLHLGRIAFRETIEPGFCGSVFAEAAALSVVLEIARHSGARQIDDERRHRGGLAPWQLRRLDEYIRSHLSEDLTLHDLAMMLNISVRHLSRAVRQSKGIGLHRWVADHRLEEARRLIADTELPITEVALRCGFKATAAFSTAFRNAVGFSPKEFRRLSK